MRELLDPLADVAGAGGGDGDEDGGGGGEEGGGGGGSMAAAALLRRFEKQSADEVAQYERRVEQEMDPETAARMRQVDEDARRLQEEMQALRTQIDAEKAMQESILRDFRHQLAAGGGDMV